MTHSGGLVTRDDVEELWSALIDGRTTWQETSRQAEALSGRVNAENPIVNWGLMTLYYLWQSEDQRRRETLIRERDRWRAKLATFDDDPPAWMREYYQRMIADHAQRRGTEAARNFGVKLARQGLIAANDVEAALADATHESRP